MIVKPLTSLLVVLLIASHFAGGDEATKKPAHRNTIPPWTFASIEEMKQWGESSAFGGGSVSEPHKLGEHTVYVVNRMHTSGMLTSELSIYTVNQNGTGAFRFPGGKARPHHERGAGQVRASARCSPRPEGKAGCIAAFLP